MRPLSLLSFCLITLVCATAVQAQDYHQSYTPWKYEKAHDRYTCEYVFHNKVDPPKKQQVVYYPAQEKKDFYYYYNPQKKTYWGRCVSHQHPNYKPQQMQWSMLKQNKWDPVSDQCPPVPGSSGGPDIAPPPPPPGI